MTIDLELKGVDYSYALAPTALCQRLCDAAGEECTNEQMYRRFKDWLHLRQVFWRPHH